MRGDWSSARADNHRGLHGQRAADGVDRCQHQHQCAHAGTQQWPTPVLHRSAAECGKHGYQLCRHLQPLGHRHYQQLQAEAEVQVRATELSQLAAERDLGDRERGHPRAPDHRGHLHRHGDARWPGVEPGQFLGFLVRQPAIDGADRHQRRRTNHHHGALRLGQHHVPEPDAVISDQHRGDRRRVHVHQLCRLHRHAALLVQLVRRDRALRVPVHAEQPQPSSTAPVPGRLHHGQGARDARQSGVDRRCGAAGRRAQLPPGWTRGVAGHLHFRHHAELERHARRDRLQGVSRGRADQLADHEHLHGHHRQRRRADQLLRACGVGSGRFRIEHGGARMAQHRGTHRSGGEQRHAHHGHQPELDGRARRDGLQDLSLDRQRCADLLIELEHQRVRGQFRRRGHPVQLRHHRRHRSG